MLSNCFVTRRSSGRDSELDLWKALKIMTSSSGEIIALNDKSKPESYGNGVMQK